MVEMEDEDPAEYRWQWGLRAWRRLPRPRESPESCLTPAFKGLVEEDKSEEQPERWWESGRPQHL